MILMLLPHQSHRLRRYSRRHQNRAAKTTATSPTTPRRGQENLEIVCAIAVMSKKKFPRPIIKLVIKPDHRPNLPL